MSVGAISWRNIDSIMKWALLMKSLIAVVVGWCWMHSQYHGCWCPGSLHRQDISSHDIDYVEYVGAGVTWGRILSTCVLSMWSNDIKCKYIFMFSLKKLAHKELIYLMTNSASCSNDNATWMINTLRSRQDGCHLTRWHFPMHFLKWKCTNFD